MSGDRDDLTESQRRLRAVVTAYFEAVKAGQPHVPALP
jgi:hypothetical protein